MDELVSEHASKVLFLLATPLNAAVFKRQVHRILLSSCDHSWKILYVLVDEMVCAHSMVSHLLAEDLVAVNTNSKCMNVSDFGFLAFLGFPNARIVVCHLTISEHKNPLSVGFAICILVMKFIECHAQRIKDVSTTHVSLELFDFCLSSLEDVVIVFKDGTFLNMAVGHRFVLVSKTDDCKAGSSWKAF